MGAPESGFEKRLRDVEGPALVGLFLAVVAFIMALSLCIALGYSGVFDVSTQVKALDTFYQRQESELDELKYAVSMLERNGGNRPPAKVYTGTDGTTYVLVDDMLYKTLPVFTKPVEDDIRIGQD